VRALLWVETSREGHPDRLARAMVGDRHGGAKGLERELGTHMPRHLRGVRRSGAATRCWTIGIT
jgi:hypothetical protein